MSKKNILELYQRPLSELAAEADRLRREHGKDRLEVCSVINARSGGCSEDCKFCAQSVHNRAGVDSYELLDSDAIWRAAVDAERRGCRHFGIVASGKVVKERELEQVASSVERIRTQLGIRVCASLGCLDTDGLVLLKQAGLHRYNHNIETSARYYASVVTTHGLEDRISTVHRAAEAGLSVCCGGIIGMGETRRDRIDMALMLKDLPVESVPVNILMPVKGTAMESCDPLGPVEVLRTIAVFRLLMPERTIKVAAGRATGLRDFQGMAFFAGANGMIIGDYLTQKGREIRDDLNLISELEGAWRMER